MYRRQTLPTSSENGFKIPQQTENVITRHPQEIYKISVQGTVYIHDFWREGQTPNR